MISFIRRHETAIHSFVLISLGMLAFWPSVSFDFVNWDDPIYVQNNSLIREWSLPNLKAVATEVMAKNYAPLNTLSYMADYSLWQLNPCGYHATNVILHLINGVLVYLLIAQLTGSRFVAFFTAALFLVHPVQIESVAWISSRKGLLCSIFMLWACIVRMKPNAGPREDAYYFGLLALALLCKAHAIVLPAIVLLYDLLVRKNRLSLAVPRQVIPGLMSLALLLVTMSAQNSMIGGVRSHMSLSLIQIIAVDITILEKYLGMLLVPTNLSVMYDPPVTGIWKQVVAGIAVLICGGFAVWRVRQQHPLLLLGCLSILLLLFPMLNFVRITTLMNDRYLYLPSIIVFSLCLSAIQRLFTVSSETVDGLLDMGAGVMRCSLGSAAVITCLVLTTLQLPVWTNSQTLWAHALKATPNLPIVRIQSALTAHGSGQIREGIRQLQIALLETQPDELDRERMTGFISDWKQSLESAKTVDAKSHDDAMQRDLLDSESNAETQRPATTSNTSAPLELPQPFLSAVK